MFLLLITGCHRKIIRFLPVVCSQIFFFLLEGSKYDLKTPIEWRKLFPTTLLRWCLPHGVLSPEGMHWSTARLFLVITGSSHSVYLLFSLNQNHFLSCPPSAQICHLSTEVDPQFAIWKQTSFTLPGDCQAFANFLLIEIVVFTSAATPTPAIFLPLLSRLWLHTQRVFSHNQTLL